MMCMARGSCVYLYAVEFVYPIGMHSIVSFQANICCYYPSGVYFPVYFCFHFALYLSLTLNIIDTSFLDHKSEHREMGEILTAKEH